MGSPDAAIFPMTPVDVDEVVEIEQRSFLTPWSREAFMSELAQTYTVYLVVRLGSKVVGYGGMHVVWEDAHVTNVAIHPLYRGRGLAKRLMLELMARARARGARRMTLEVRVSNKPARELYVTLGFETQPGAIRRGYYTDTGEDAIVMWKDPLIADTGL